MHPPEPPVIAIDGPAASGKGTLARGVAEELGFHLLDSGALYRLVAVAAQRQGVDALDAQGLGAIAQDLDCAFRSEGVLLHGEPVDTELRTEAVSSLASRVAAVPEVRGALLARQRAFRIFPGLVADGRDMGSVVFPDARVKVYLTASPEERARRRHKQLIENGMCASLSVLLQDLRERDVRDASRGHAPLMRSEGSHLLDTTGLGVRAAVDQVLAWYGQASAM